MFCPKCGNEIKEAAKFCPKSGKELVNQQGSAQQNSNQAQNSQQNKNVKKHTIITKQNIGLIVGIAFMFLAGISFLMGDGWGIFLIAIGVVIMFYTKS